MHLGIDYGTANTRVSLYDGTRIPFPLIIGHAVASSTLMPSTCWVNPSGDILVGEQTLSRPDRLKFVKRYWQARPEDEDNPDNPWRKGKMTRGGKVFTCEQMAERVISEAIARAFGAAGGEAKEGFSANIVCPASFDLGCRHVLARILCDQGARSVTIGNVIDEPLAAAVLYGKVATTPPVNQDLLVFDAGAGTTDAAIVRYHEQGEWKRITVLAEQGICWAGSDLDLAVQDLVIRRIGALMEIDSREQIYSAYGMDSDVGKLNFEDECEQIKIALSTSPSYRWAKPNFMGRQLLTFDITREEFRQCARNVLSEMGALIKSLLREASSFVEDFDGIDLALLVGGTSKLPMVRDIVTTAYPRMVIHQDEVYFDEMTATVRGIGFTKDFGDLVIKRPPYTIQVRVTLDDGSVVPNTIHQAFDKAYDWWRTFQTANPYKEVTLDFERPVDTLELLFISPSGHRQAADLSPGQFRGDRKIIVRLNVRASLSLNSYTIQMPYFTQVGLKPPQTFDPKRLNAPDVYPDDN